MLPWLDNPLVSPISYPGIQAVQREDDSTGDVDDDTQVAGRGYETEDEYEYADEEEEEEEEEEERQD